MASPPTSPLLSGVYPHLGRSQQNKNRQSHSNGANGTVGAYGDQPVAITKAKRQQMKTQAKTPVTFNDTHSYISELKKRTATNFTVKDTKGNIKLYSWTDDGKQTCVQVSWYYVDSGGFLHIGNKNYDYTLPTTGRYYNSHFPDQIQNWSEIEALVHTLTLATTH